MSQVYKCDVCGKICKSMVTVTFASSSKYCDPYTVDLCSDCTKSVSILFNIRACEMYNVGRNLDDFILDDTL